MLDKLNGLNATPEETKEFRKLLARMDFCEYLHQQIFFDWKHKKVYGIKVLIKIVRNSSRTIHDHIVINLVEQQ